MREFLSDHQIPFDDRNIRQSDVARNELQALASDLIVPQLFWGNHHIIGFDPAALQEFSDAYQES